MLIYPPLTKRMFNTNVSVFLFLVWNGSDSGWYCGSDFNEVFFCVRTIDVALLKKQNYELKHAG